MLMSSTSRIRAKEEHGCCVLVLIKTSLTLSQELLRLSRRRVFCSSSPLINSWKWRRIPRESTDSGIERAVDAKWPAKGGGVIKRKGWVETWWERERKGLSNHLEFNPSSSILMKNILINSSCSSSEEFNKMVVQLWWSVGCSRISINLLL